METSRKRRPLIGLPASVLFVCFFLPTLRVCGSPSFPFEFPPVYIVHVGALLFLAAALVKTLRTARILTSVWLALLVLSATSIFALLLADASAPLALSFCGLMLIIAPFLARTLYRSTFGERGVWIAATGHGIASACWYLLLASDHDHMWGAYVGLASATLMAIMCAAAAGEIHAARRAARDDDAPVPPARIV
ncbi:MAG TPA: hypothetical protein VGM90_16975 [Kofleriaceae bacterium]|jgi:hypothetical protein